MHLSHDLYPLIVMADGRPAVRHFTLTTRHETGIHGTKRLTLWAYRNSSGYIAPDVICLSGYAVSHLKFNGGLQLHEEIHVFITLQEEPLRYSRVYEYEEVGHNDDTAVRFFSFVEMREYEHDV